MQAADCMSDASERPSTNMGRRNRARRGGLKVLPPQSADDGSDCPQGMQRAADLLLNLAMQGEIGRVVERWPATSLVELRDAINDVIRTTADRGEENVQFRPAEIVLAH